MIRQVLFDGKVEVGISEISDGNMRFFGDGDEAGVELKNVRGYRVDTVENANLPSNSGIWDFWLFADDVLYGGQ